MKPGNVFLYDSLDKENPKQQAPIIRQDWRVYLILLIGIVLAVLLLIGIHTWGWYLLSTPQYRLGLFILAFIYVPFGLLMIGATLSSLIMLYNWARKKGLVNLMQFQSHIDMLKDYSDRYFDVQEREAARMFPQVQNMTYNPTYREPAPYVEEQKVEEPLKELPLLDELREKGLVARSGNSLLMGFEED